MGISFGNIVLMATAVFVGDITDAVFTGLVAAAIWI